MKIGHEELQSYMLINSVKSEEQMLAMINFFVKLAINNHLEQLGLAPEKDEPGA